MRVVVPGQLSTPSGGPSTVSVHFVVDTRLHDKEAILRAAYEFTDRCYVFLESVEPQGVQVTMSIKPDETGCEDRLTGEFQNALLHWTLRRSIARETKGIREVILGRALFGTVIPAEDATVGDPSAATHAHSGDTEPSSYTADPHEVAKSWFE